MLLARRQFSLTISRDEFQNLSNRFLCLKWRG